MAQGTATSFAVPNFSGMLFTKGQTATPFSTDWRKTSCNQSCRVYLRSGVQHRNRRTAGDF